MSIISNDHSFVPFISGKSKAFEGQRLAQITFKTVTDENGKKSKRDSVCVSVPVMALSNEQVLSLREHVTALVHKAQDNIIRERVIAGQTSVNDAHIDFNAVVEYLNEEATSGRLDKETVIEWFNQSEGFADKLRVVFADKLGVSDTPSEEETKQIEQKVNQYRECYASLASGKKMFEKARADILAKTIVKYCDTDNDAIAQKFYDRLNRMANAVEETLDTAL